MSELKSMYVPVKMTPAELAALRMIATERCCSVASVVRWAVRKSVMADPPSPPKNEGYANVSQAAGAPFGIQSQPSA